MEIEFKEEDFALVEKIIKTSGNSIGRIPLIKEIRIKTGYGLLESKRLVDVCDGLYIEKTGNNDVSWTSQRTFEANGIEEAYEKAQYGIKGAERLQWLEHKLATIKADLGQVETWRNRTIYNMDLLENEIKLLKRDLEKVLKDDVK